MGSNEYYWKHRDKQLANMRAWYQAHKNEFNARNKPIRKKNAEKIKLEVLTHYSGGTPICACCGETIIEFLTLDHVNNDGNKARQLAGKSFSGRWYYEWLKRNNYPSDHKLQVLCYNCNCGKSKRDACPHKARLS